jgi:hypothetical protein
VQDYSQRACGQRTLDERAWHNDTPHANHLAQVKAQPDPKQKQNDSYFSELLCDRAVGDKPRSERSDKDPGKKVAHYGGDPQPLREKAENQSPNQSARKCQNHA